MSAKRSRIGSSGDTGLLSPAPAESSNPRLHGHTAYENCAKALKRSPEAEQSPPSVMTIPSPETVIGREVQADQDQFLDSCYLCHRRLPHNEDVFMYGPFRAFCSPECRDQQIGIDKRTKQQKQAIG